MVERWEGSSGSVTGAILTQPGSQVVLLQYYYREHSGNDRKGLVYRMSVYFTFGSVKNTGSAVLSSQAAIV